MKRYHKNSFTLIELLAAMAVFSVLLMVSLRLFSGAQQMWLRSEQKTDTFASGRTAMEFIASRMQSLIYIDDDRYPFGIDDNMVWFASSMATGDGGHSRHFLQFRLVDPAGSFANAGTLQMIRYRGQNEKAKKNFFVQLFPPYGNPNRQQRKITKYDQAVKHIEKVFEEVEDKNKDNPTVDGAETRAVAIDICENVVGLKFTRFIANEASHKLNETAKTGYANAAPYLVEVELKMLDSRESFLKWKNATGSGAKNDIFVEHGYTFRRAILLGKKGTE